MHPVLKRIVVNGGATAALLAVIGVGYAELAGIWLSSGTTPRPSLGDPTVARPAGEPVTATLRYRVPAVMALWGFLFVAAGEGVIYLIRGNKAAKIPQKPAEPDPAEILLEELMKQAESVNAVPPAEPAPSPSPMLAENSPVSR
jgi:hypothetical protein